MRITIKDNKIEFTAREVSAISSVNLSFSALEFDGIKTAVGSIEWNGKKYLVGKEAVLRGLPELPKQNEFIKTILPLFVLKYGNKFDRIHVLISPRDWHLKKELIDILSFAKGEVKVYPQGIGPWILAGCPKDCIVFDIGFRTVEVIVVSSWVIRRDLSFALETGIGSFAGKIVADTPFNIAEGFIKKDSRFERIKRDYWIYLFNQLDSVRIFKDVYNHSIPVILSGGGAYLHEFIPDNIKPKKIKVIKNPEFANINGLIKLLKQQEVKNEKVHQNNPS